MNAIGDLNLWALGFDSPTRAREVHGEIMRFAGVYSLHVNDVVIVVRQQNGSFALERDAPASVATGVLGTGCLGLFVGLVVLQPLAGAAIGAVLGGLAATSARQLGIDDGFLGEVKELIKPGTSALFLLTKTDNPDAVLHHIRGLGGTVLKTNVNDELARQVQETLNTPRPTE